MDVSIEKRQFDRKLLFHYLKVMNSKTGSLAGYLGDISSDGLMLFSPEEFKPGRQFRFRINLDKEFGKGESLEFEAQSIWCRKDANPEYNVVGFCFVRPGEQEKDRVSYLISKYGCGL